MFFLAGNIPYSQKRRYPFTGSDQTFTVPSGVFSIRVKCWGGAGGGGFAQGRGGGGGFTQADIAVTGGETLTVKVGGGGAYANVSTTTYPDGQPANWSGASAGGGSSGVFKSGVSVGAGAGGGAGDGNPNPQPGSPGGTSTGASPTGGAGGTRFDGGGAGGVSATTGGTNTTVTGGSTWQVANSADIDYPGNVGNGGTDGAAGQNGYVVIIY